MKPKYGIPLACATCTLIACGVAFSTFLASLTIGVITLSWVRMIQHIFHKTKK